MEGFQELSSNRKRTIKHQQIDLALNASITKFVSDKFSRSVDKTGRLIGFYDNQKRIDDIQSLIVKNVPLTFSAIPTEKAIQCSLPGNYRYLINDRTLMQGTSRPVPNEGIDIEYAYDILDSYYRRPKPNKPLSLLADNKIIVFLHESSTASQVIIDYIRKPATVALKNEFVSMLVGGELTNVEVKAANCDLPDHVHRIITDTAIQELLLNVNSPAYQMKIQDNIIKNTE
jgi:hypothetical protein